MPPEVIRNPLPIYITQKYYPSLNGFRGLAILGVIISHLVRETKASQLGFLGIWGVDLFFVLSGFLITTLLIREKESTGRISLSMFYTRRALRIFPSALLFLLVMLLFNRIYSLGISVAGFITAALYVKNLPIRSAGNDWYLGHFWTLSAEEQYYLIVPSLLSSGYLLFKRVGVAVILCAYTSIILAFHVWKSFLPLHYLVSVLGPEISLMLGSLTSLLVCEGKISIPSFNSLWSFLLLFVSLLFESQLVPMVPHLLSGTFAAICFCVLIVSGIQPVNSIFYSFTNNRTICFIGLLSYSLYIWQQIFTVNTFMFSYPHSAELDTLINLLALFLFSAASYYGFERYFLRVKSHFARV